MLAPSLVLKFSCFQPRRLSPVKREPLLLCYGHLAGDTIRWLQNKISDHCYPAMFQQMLQTRRFRHFHTSKIHSADFLGTKSQPLRPSVSYFEFLFSAVRYAHNNHCTAMRPSYRFCMTLTLIKYLPQQKTSRAFFSNVYRSNKKLLCTEVRSRWKFAYRYLYLLQMESLCTCTML
jgi:hypothetical protein